MLSKHQNTFIDHINLGHNIFLTGKAGTGKSFVVKHAIQLLKDQKKRVAAIAPTGVAANNIQGQTIHSMFSIKPFGVASFDTCNFLKTEKRRLMDAIDVLFIDEVSMFRPDILDAINWTLIKNGCKSLLTKQIVFIGDMKQLKPILDDNTRSVLYRNYEGAEFYHAEIFKKLKVYNVELDEVLRQTNEEFIHNLNIVRDGGKSEYFRRFVGTDLKGIILAPHNSTVEEYNNDGLYSLPGEKLTFEASVTGNVKADDFNLPSIINVKEGAKIMYLVNSSADNDLINGTLGTFHIKEDKYFIRVGEVDYALNIHDFTKKEYVLNEAKDDLELREIGTISQYPFKLAFALSIHKAQGLTFDEVTIDLRRACFEQGQLYVALSRVTKPEGLRIITK